MRSRRLALLTALAVALSASDASGEILHLKSPSTLQTERGSILQLPPGYFLDENEWRDRNFEMERLQAQETRLEAENGALRASADDFPWLSVGVAGVVGVALGVFVMTL